MDRFTTLTRRTFAACIIAGSSLAAQAGDVKVLAGVNACLPADPNSEMNVGTGDMTTLENRPLIMCGIDRDLPHKNRIPRVTVTGAVGTSEAGDVNCTLYSLPTSGSGGTLSHSRTVANPQGPLYQLHFRNVRVVRHSTLVLVCSFPRHTGVRAITIDE